MLFHGSALVWLYRTPLAEETVETAVLLRRALRADLGRIEGEGVVLDEHVLGLPPAVAVVGLGLDHGGLHAFADRGQGGIDERAVAGRRVPVAAAVPVGVLVEHDTAPVIGERVVRDFESAAEWAGNPAVRS